ncbi:FAD binding domain-containing protein [Xylariales sp. PMI_506]|nr:FAD binding domain-containing protein [Xylariales sp. PMI_506]
MALPVLIIGAGISGLLLAQLLRKSGVPYLIFERDPELTYRGLGWGLTLHWSLPDVHSILPPELLARLPDIYVDSDAVAAEEPSRFPFYDLSTGAEIAATPPLPSTHRIRITRQRLRELIATGVDVRWGMGIRDVEEQADGVVRARFENGEVVDGSLLIGCDGNASRVRRSLFPEIASNYQIPVRVTGIRATYTPEEIAPLRALDPFFLQGTASENNSFIYFRLLVVLDAPGNTSNETGKYEVQVVMSWPLREGFFGNPGLTEFRPTSQGQLEFMREVSRTWAEPFRSIFLNVPDDTEVKALELGDWPPPLGLHGPGLATLMGDSFHGMAMYRGEGANHAIADVTDFAIHVLPKLQEGAPVPNLREAVHAYEAAVVARARPGVLASRRACLDAHDWAKISKESPLLSKRARVLDFTETEADFP